MWNGIFLDAQTCLDNFKQVREYFVFLSIPYAPPSLLPTSILVSVVMSREICAFFLFDCSQWEVVWGLFPGRMQSQCPVGGLRKLERFDASTHFLKGTNYAYLQQCRKRERNMFFAFLMRRKSSAWNWNLRRFLRSANSDSIQQPTYRYSLPLSLDLHSIWVIGLLPCALSDRVTYFLYVAFNMKE